MNTNQYAPRQVYEDITSTLEAFRQQSDVLHSTFATLGAKCAEYGIVSEEEIDGLIDAVRDYALTKENCLDLSSQVLDVSDATSIDEVASKVKEHQNHSQSIMDDILYYAYEFLKIQSSNVITDGLLHDHHEKLNALIDSMVNEFVDIEDVTRRLEPYKLAILYVTKQISDLTPYAETMYNAFGAILFYNVVSGNNLEYHPEDSDSAVHTVEVATQCDKTFDIMEELNLFHSNEDAAQPILDFEIPVVAEVNEVVEFDSTSMVDLEPVCVDAPSQDAPYVTDASEEATEPILEEPSDTVEYSTLEDGTASPSEPELATTEPSEGVESEPELEAATAVLEDSPLGDEATELEPAPAPEATEGAIPEGSTLEEEATDSAVSEEEATVEESAEPEDYSDVAETLEEDGEEEVDYFENLSSTIRAKYDEPVPVDEYSKPQSEDSIVETFCSYVDLRQFACASLLLRDSSKRYKSLETLYVQYGLALGDPCISSDYSVAFMDVANESLHPWLELSSLFRAMFTCKDKDVECYNFAPYIGSLTQNLQDTVLECIPNFHEILDTFNAIDYNTNYLTGIKLFDDSNNIVLSIKKRAKEMLLYCENTIRPWNHKAMIAATKSLFSSGGGYVYSLVKEVSLGNFSVTEQIQEYCSRFAGDDGRMLEGIYLDKAIEEYLHEQLSMANTKKNNYNSCDTDINVGYKNKFTNRFSNILRFMFDYVEEMNAISVNSINESNVLRYKKLQSTLVNLLTGSSRELNRRASETVSATQRAGMLCLAKTFDDVVAYANYENYRQNYYYCELLKTGYFMLDDVYIPYLDDSTSRVHGLEVTTRIAKHIEESRYVGSWKDAVEANLKKSNVGNVKLMLAYLKDTDQGLDEYEYQEYLDRADAIEYSVDDTFARFRDEVQSLYLMEVVPNRGVLNTVFRLENVVRMAIFDTRNYGFYETFLGLLKDYVVSVSEESYGLKSHVLDYVGQTEGYDSDYYGAIVDGIDSHRYCVSDELMSMYFDSVEYPKGAIDTSQFSQYDEIYSNFKEFCDRYASDMSSPNGYVFMNEFYNTYIRDTVTERFGSSYDTVNSDDLILDWVRGQGSVNVIYDILVNIGFSIDSHEDIDVHTCRMVLSNSERNHSQPYVIPEYAVFLNGIYNIAQTDRHIANLRITQDTLIILDYALSNYERDHVQENLGKVSNGNRVVLIDRCAIMYLTTVPLNLRKLAFKVCSLCDVSNSVTCGSNFRRDYVQSFAKDSRCNLLLGREYFGKTHILNSVANVLGLNSDYTVVYVDAYDDDLSTPSLFLDEYSKLEVRLNPSEGWESFENATTKYLNRNPHRSLVLLIDNVDGYLQERTSANGADGDGSDALAAFKRLSSRFKDRFSFTMAADVYHEYVAYAERNGLTYTTLKPLSYDETATLFENHLNSARVFVKDRETMTVLVSKAFGCPETVRLISRQIVSTVNDDPNAFKDSYLYGLGLDTVTKALSDTDFIDMVGQVFLSTVIGSKESSSAMLPVVYAIVYYLYEHSTEDTFTAQDVVNVLSVFDIEEGERLNVRGILEELQTLGLVCRYTDDEYFLAHEYYKNYLGNKEFAFDTLDDCTRVFTKEGVS